VNSVQKRSGSGRRGRRVASQVAMLVVVVSSAGAAEAQQRPLVTEDPETVGAGRILLEAGVSAEHDAVFPVSGLVGNRWVVPTLGLSIGVSSIAEIQVDFSPYQHLSITERRPAPLDDLLEIDGDSTSDVEDLVVATKIRIVSESGGRPSLGIRVATQLPDASNESGLGTDLTNFYATLLLGKTIQSVRIVGNAGLAILGDPTGGVPEQNDLLTYGVSFARALTTAGEIVAELNGRYTNSAANDPGAETRAMVTVGGRYTRGPVRVDGGVLLGMTSHDPDVGFTAGLTWVFNAFRVP
jgi:hypothetical protein